MAEETYTIFEVKIEQDHVNARSPEDAAAKYFDAHPEVEEIRVLSRKVGTDGDWFDTAQHLSDSTPFGQDSRHPCDRCGGPAFDGECADPICNQGGNDD